MSDVEVNKEQVVDTKNENLNDNVNNECTDNLNDSCQYKSKWESIDGSDDKLSMMIINLTSYIFT
jgi:hypothetical protein